MEFATEENPRQFIGVIKTIYNDGAKNAFVRMLIVPADPNVKDDDNMYSARRGHYDRDVVNDDAGVAEQLIKAGEGSRWQVTWYHGAEKASSTKVPKDRYRTIARAVLVQDQAYSDPVPETTAVAPTQADQFVETRPSIYSATCNHGVPYVGGYSDSCGRCISRSGVIKVAGEIVKERPDFHTLTLDQLAQKISTLTDLLISIVEESYSDVNGEEI